MREKKVYWILCWFRVFATRYNRAAAGGSGRIKKGMKIFFNEKLIFYTPPHRAWISCLCWELDPYIALIARRNVIDISEGES